MNACSAPNKRNWVFLGTYKKRVDDAKLFSETLPEGSKNRISEVRISQGPVVAHSLAMV